MPISMHGSNLALAFGEPCDEHMQIPGLKVGAWHLVHVHVCTVRAFVGTCT